MQYDITPELHGPAVFSHLFVDLQKEVQVHSLLAHFLAQIFAFSGSQIKGLIASNVELLAGKVGCLSGNIIDGSPFSGMPKDKLEAVLNNVRALQKQEEKRMGLLRNAKTAAEVRAIFSGHSYAKKEKKS